MKTVKFVIILCLMLGFTSHALIGQQANTPPLRFTYWQKVTLDIPCLGESITGVLDFDVMVLNQMWIGKRNGIMVGDDSGIEYSVYFIGKQISEPRPATSWTEPFTILIRYDRKLVANVHVTFHYTFNANGELKTAFWMGQCN